jgi:hypothetical protein
MNYIYELFALLIVFVVYWYFNIIPQSPISIDMPIENMKNISIFDGNILDNTNH